MEEIQVGEFVRTDKGKIVKIDGSWKYSTNNAGTILFVNISKIPVNYYAEKILKHSFNLIDLIEEGDYVNGHKVTAVYLDGATKYLKLDNAYKYGEGIRTYAENIKSIVTHEQFTRLEYKVEEK